MAGTRVTKAQLTEELEVLRAKVTVLEHAEAAWQASEDTIRAFEEKLVALHEITIELSQITDFGILYRRAIELAQSRLGYERIALFLIDKDNPPMMIGTFGTDTQGRIRDERGTSLSMETSVRISSALAEKARFRVWEDATIWDEEKAVGHGWRLMAMVWNGAEGIGWLATDNLITQSPLLSFQPELLALYGASLGHLITNLQTQSALRESEARYRTLIETSPDAIAIIDTQGDIIYASPRLVEMLKTDAPEVIVGTPVLQWIAPHDREKAAHSLIQTMQTTPAVGNEYTIVDMEGSYFTGEVRTSVLYDAEGKPTAIISIVRDVTRRKQIEEALSRSEQEKTAVLDSMSERVIYQGTDLRIVWANRAASESIGLPPEALVGRYCHEIWHQETGPCVDCPVIHARDTAQTHQSEMKMADGRTWLVQGYPVKNVAGIIEGIVEVSQDITERIQSEQHRIALEIEKASANILRSFLSHASHDLRIPLTTIKTRLYLLQKDPDPDKKQQHLAILNEEVIHLEQLLEDMLNMTRLDRRLNFTFRSVDVNKIISSVVAQHTPLAASRNITLTFAGEPVLSSIRADRVNLEGAIGKIVMNALYYTPSRGKVNIRTYEQDQHVVIEVQDNGIGITKDELPHIFQRFYRADKARNTTSGGAGLGLAIAKKVIEGHQGTIQVDSEAGEGSTFKIFLPKDTQ